MTLFKKNLKIKNILVTGASGFIGSHFCELLINNNYNVIGVDNFYNSSKKYIKNLLNLKNFTFIKKDVRKIDKNPKTFKNIDLAIHLASNTDIINSHDNPDADFSNTLETTNSLLKLLKENNTKNLIFSSSGACYGDLCLSLKVNEKSGPLNPLSSYAAAKISSEALISSYSHLYGIKACAFRFGNVIGDRMSHGVIFDFIKRLKKNPSKLEIYGNGKQIKNYFLVNDCIEGMIKLYNNTKFNSEHPFEIYNIGAKSRTNVKKIAKIVLEEMNLKKTKIIIKGDKKAWPGDQPIVNFSINKAHKNGWTCPVSSDDAVKKATKLYLKKIF